MLLEYLVLYPKSWVLPELWARSFEDSQHPLFTARVRDGSLLPRNAYMVGSKTINCRKMLLNSVSGTRLDASDNVHDV